MKKVAVMLAVVLAATTGCRFEHKKGADDHDNNVKFATPFGGMSVKTDERTVQAGVGLTPYPGAVLNSKDAGSKDDGAADVNFSFGNFHLGVKALSFQSSDAPAKVLAFYRKDMEKYGTVILCSNGAPVGQPTRTQDGLTCDSDSQGTEIHINADGQQDLKAGSRLHQHIVSVEPKGGGSKIGLVMLDLPGTPGDDDSKE